MAEASSHASRKSGLEEYRWSCSKSDTCEAGKHSPHMDAHFINDVGLYEVVALGSGFKDRCIMAIRLQSLALCGRGAGGFLLEHPRAFNVIVFKSP